MYLIKVAFIKEQNQYSSKEYWFKTPFEFNIGVQFKDRRYQDLMEITHIEPWTGKGERSIGFVVKTINYSTIEYFKEVVKIKPNNMEKRNITISLEEAREWYNSDNKTLRTVALQAYSQKELEEPQTFKELCKKLGIKGINFTVGATAPSTETPNISALTGVAKYTFLMGIAARYFNGDEFPKIGEKRYFIGRTASRYTDSMVAIELEEGYAVLSHLNVGYPGIIYFKRAEDAKKAFELVTKEN